MEQRKKERKEVDTGSSQERKLKAGFLHVCLPGHRSDNVFVCMHTRHPVCLASLVNSNYRWTYRKVNNSKRIERGVKTLQPQSVRAVKQQNTITFIRTNTHQNQTCVISLVCGPKQGSQRAGFPDVSYYPAALTRPSWSPHSLSLTSQNQEGRSKAD